MADVAATRTGGSAIPIPSFAGFSDFDLDLSCLSPPASPSNSPLGMLASNSAPSSPRSSRSFFSHGNNSTMSDGSPARKMSPTSIISPSVATTVIRGSWPLIKYVGRGTPIDKTRRVEWGAFGGEEVAEDGLLFSTARSSSLDSVAGPSRRSVSAEWNFLGASPQTSAAHGHGPVRSKSRLFDQPPPELEPLSTESSAEWSSLMQRVLQSATPDVGESGDATPRGSRDNPDERRPQQEEEDEDLDPGPNSDKPAQSTADDETGMTLEEIRQLDMELGDNLGLNDALNLGLSLRGDGMNVFNLGIVPSPGEDTPSVYPSDEGIPHASRPPSMRVLGVMSNGSASTTGRHPSAGQGAKHPRSWWIRFIKSLRRMHSLLHVHHPKRS